MSKDFSNLVASDVDLEELYAEIQYNNKAVAILTQEEGLERLKIQLLPNKDGGDWNFYLADFFEAIEKAKHRLCGMRKLK